MGNTAGKPLDGAGLAVVNEIIESRYVPIARRINNKALSADLSLTAADVGAATMDQVNAAIDAAISGAIAASY